MTSSARADRLAIFGSALLFSTGGVAIKWISLGPWQVAAVRAALAAIAVWLLVPGPVTIRRRAVLATGVAQGSSMLLFVIANKLTTAANAIFLQSAAPLYIPLLASRVLGERTTKRDLAAMTGIAVGLACFFIGAEAPSATAPNPRLGDIVAVASGVAWACTVVGLRYLARESPRGAEERSEETSVPDAWIQVAANAEAAEHEHDIVPTPPAAAGSRAGEDVVGAAPSPDHSDTAVAARAAVSSDAVVAAKPPASPGAAKGALIAGNFFVVLVSIPMALPMPHTSSSDWAILVFLGTAQVALAYRLLVRAVARVPALEASLLALFEPVLNPLWAFLVLGERPSAWAFAGATILAAVTIARAAAGARQAT